MKRIIVDTSSILFALSYHVDPFEAILMEFPASQVVISEGILRELKGIGGSTKRNAAYANLALSMIAKKSIKAEKNNEYPDTWLAKAAKSYNCPVCTNDIKLKKVLRLKGIRVFSIGKDGKLR